MFSDLSAEVVGIVATTFELGAFAALEVEEAGDVGFGNVAGGLGGRGFCKTAAAVLLLAVARAVPDVVLEEPGAPRLTILDGLDRVDIGSTLVLGTGDSGLLARSLFTATVDETGSD